MGLQSQNIDPHWNYFFAIERDLDELSRYVEFSDKNFDCFGIEIARILLACGAEVDVACKQVCRAINSKSKAGKIHEYRTEIGRGFPDVDIPNYEVLIPRFGLTLAPWNEWKKKNGVPLWWTAYNKIKHHRESKYEQANLKNTLDAVAGLLVILLLLNHKKNLLGQRIPVPLLLRTQAMYNGSLIDGPSAVYGL